MASTKSTTRKSQSKTSKTQTIDEWHEERYGEHRNKLSDVDLKQLVEDICGKNWDEQSASALVLLMDEFERSQFDRMHVSNITDTISNAAFRYTSQHDSAAKNLVVGMRREISRKEVVN